MVKGRSDVAPVFVCPVCGCEMQLVRGRAKPNGSRGPRYEMVLHCFGDPDSGDVLPVHSPMDLDDYNLTMRLKLYGPGHSSNWNRKYHDPVLAEFFAALLGDRV